MPITLLDIILLLVMLISGLLAMIRGFMREILSIGAWIIAALVTLYGYSRVLPVGAKAISAATWWRPASPSAAFSCSRC